jgi:hypothetical protein
MGKVKEAVQMGKVKEETQKKYRPGPFGLCGA